MDLQLVEDRTNKKLSFYAKGGFSTGGDECSLLGFKESYAVLDAAMIKVRYISLSPSSKPEMDKTGRKFVNWKGRILKIVPPAQIPKVIQEQTLKLKKQLANIAAKSATEIQPTNSNPFPFEHVNKDNCVEISYSFKNVRLITAPVDNQVIHSSTTVSSGFPAKLAISNSETGVKPLHRILPEANKRVKGAAAVLVNSDVDKEILPVIGKTTYKLLSQKNLKILNQVKMKALNLSMKPLQMKEVGDSRCGVTVEIGVQTDELNKKQLCHQLVQTDMPKQLNLMDYMSMNLENILSINTKDESPILHDVNLGTGPTMNGFSDQRIVGRSPSPFDSIAQNSAVNQPEDKHLLKTKMLFFTDLRECLTYNTEGNLSLHEGVIKNDLSVVKRQCAALKARKAGVNLENHNGCTALQLAIINNADVEIVRTLLDCGADIRAADFEGNNILHLGAKFERLSIVEVILGHDTFMSCFDCINSYNFEGLTPLMICCISSWTDGALMFINREASVNLRDQTSGKTALFHAAEAQNVGIVQMLLTNGADPKVKNFFGTSPHDAMYELEDMDEAIKRLIFGISKKRSIEAEMNPNRTAKAARHLKTYRKFQKIQLGSKFPLYTIVQK